MNNSLRLLAIATLFCYNATAQNSSNHLLWRISGKGLSKPSYLFGTMHLTDKRLFYFGDSLYRALEQTEGFAAELDFNAFLNKYFDKLIGQGGFRALVKDRVDASVIEKNRGKLEQKFKKPADEITLEDLKEEENSRRTKLLQSGEMETFMDAYLLGLADKQGKWIGGIEDPEDQLDLDEAFSTESRINSLFEENDEEGKKELEWMLQTYLKENMESIDRSNDLWKGAKDLILIRRNVKMAYRVDSIAHVRSCFFAVGAAHLPGDSGVVKLLRDRGYTVTPVISSRRIDPGKYKYREVKREWVNVWGKDSLYSVMMPLQPLPIPALSDSPFDMLFHYDLPSNTAYLTASVPTLVSAIQDSAIANLERVYKTQATSFEKKKISWNGMKGYEFLMEIDNAYLRMQIFTPASYLTMNMVAAVKKQALTLPNSTRFLQSFKPDTLRAVRLMAKMKAMGVQQFDFKEDGFSVQSTVKLKRSKVETGSESPWDRIKFEGFSPVTQSYYIITKDVTRPGYYSNKDSAYFKEMEKNYIEATGAEVISSEIKQFEGYPSYEILMKLNRSGAHLNLKFLLINRGNYRYTLFKTYDANAATNGSDDPLFTSFRLLPLVSSPWKSIRENDFSTFGPDTAPRRDTTEQGNVVYTMYDSVTATTFTATKEVLPANYWVADDSTLFEQRLRTFYFSYKDSVVSKRRNDNGDVKSMDILIKLGDSHVMKRMKLIQHADTLYTLYSFLSPDLLKSGPYSRFFMDFKPNHPAGNTTIFTSKAKKLLQELLSTDSAVFVNAKESISGAPFIIQDLPLLQEAMLKIYQDRDTAYQYVYGKVNDQLMSTIMKLDTAGSYVTFIKENYSRLKADQAFVRPMMLNMLSSRHTKTSYGLLKQYLSLPLPDRAGSYYLDGLSDSLALSRLLFPEAFNALDNKGFAGQVANLTMELLDSGYMDMGLVMPEKARLLRAASRLFNEDEESISQGGGFRYVELLNLVGRLKDAESNALLRRASKIGSLEIAETALLALLRNDEKVTAAELLPLAESDEYRIELYDSLAKMNKLSLFPPAYLTQRALGQSYIFSEAYDDAEPVVSFIREKIFEYKGSKKKFYLYKVFFGDGDDDTTEGQSFLAVAGPYSLDAKELKTDRSATGVYWTGEFDEKKIDELFAAYMKQLAEEEEKQDE